MRKQIVAFFLGFVVAAVVFAQAPQRLLSDGDVKRFVRDYKPMSGELEALGQETSVEPDGFADIDAMLNALRVNADAQRVLRKYGWGDSAYPKYSAIILSYLTLKLEQGRLEAGGDLAATIAEIEANPQIPAGQKAAIKAQISGMAEAETKYRALVHPGDLSTVGANLEALDKAFE